MWHAAIDCDKYDNNFVFSITHFNKFVKIFRVFLLSCVCYTEQNVTVMLLKNDEEYFY